MKKNRIKKILWVTSIITVLNACSDEKNLQKIKNELAREKQTVIQNVKNDTPEKIVRIDRVNYHETSRMPFEITVANLQKNSIQPLTMFSIDTLRFVGTVTEGHKIWAVIITPDNLTYKVKLGDILGDHYGKIINITQNKIEIMESFIENEKATTQKVVTLQLKDEH